jgi:hypothetical protein
MGLGNRLYPWARCHLYSLQHNIPMLAPRWWWPPRVRPLLKEIPPAIELPGHLYVKGMRALPEYISGARRMLIEATSRSSIRVFRGEAGRFNDLHGHETQLYEALSRISTSRVDLPKHYIAMHVRRGDFSEQARTPLEWFLAALRSLRAATHADIPVRIVSDGTAADLAILLSERNVQLVRTHVPLGDLLALAGARVLLASGSSFSAWAAFLGGMPAATQPGHSLEWFGVRPRSYVGHYHPDADNAEFLDAAAAAMGANRVD